MIHRQKIGKRWIAAVLAAVLAAALPGTGALAAQTTVQATWEADLSGQEMQTAADAVSAETAASGDALLTENAGADMLTETESAADGTGVLEAGLTAAAGEDTAQDESGAFTMAITGDYLLSYVRANYDAGGIDGIISADYLEELNAADLTLMNLEFPLGVGGTQAVKTYTFKEDPAYAVTLNELGADIVSLANNHTLDYGTEVLQQTFDTLDAIGVAYVGAGTTLEEASDWETVEVNGTSIGFLAASYIDPIYKWDVTVTQPGLFNGYDMDTLLEQIIWAKEANDLVVVYLHWGYEYTNTPAQYQRDVAMACIDAGADLIVGAHSHQLQGIEYYNGTPIFYSLGNFIFSMRTQDTALLKVTADEERNLTFRLLPGRCTGGYTEQIYGEEAQELLDYIESISFGVTIDENGTISQTAG